MKMIFSPRSRLGLPLPVRFLLLLVMPALYAVDMPAQDTTKARVPQVALIRVLQREAMNHYINVRQTDEGHRIELFNGTRETVLDFANGTVLVSISPNQRYFTIAKPITNRTDIRDPYDRLLAAEAFAVELRNLDNTVLAKGRLTRLGDDEMFDEFVPTDDGLSLIHKVHHSLSGNINFIFYKYQKGRLQRHFEINKSEYINGLLSYEPAQQMLVVSYAGTIPGTIITQTYVQCYSIDGALKWETSLDSQFVELNMFISKLDGTIAFASHNDLDGTHANLFLFKKNGEKIRQVPVHHIGSYKASDFRLINGKQYFLSSSGVEYYYIIDTESGNIVNSQTHASKGIRITDLVPYQELIVTPYYTLYHRPGPNNTKEPVPEEQGVGIMDLQGRIEYIPLNVTGVPYLFFNKSALYIREQKSFFEDQNNFYKIKMK